MDFKFLSGPFAKDLIARSETEGLPTAYYNKKKDQSAMRARVMACSQVLLAIFLTTSAPAFAADIEHGKILLDQHCTRCHDTRVFTRPDRKIGSLEALRSQVKRCESSQSLDWPQPDVDDVAAYLNAAFYKFGGATAQK